jgi:hypothetical protein
MEFTEQPTRNGLYWTRFRHLPWDDTTVVEVTIRDGITWITAIGTDESFETADFIRFLGPIEVPNIPHPDDTRSTRDDSASD